MGYLGTKYKKKNLLSILYSLRALSICIFIFSPPSMLNSIVFGITFGLLWLSTVPPTNGIVAQIFGTKYLSTLFGIVFYVINLELLLAHFGVIFLIPMEVMIMLGIWLLPFLFLLQLFITQ